MDSMLRFKVPHDISKTGKGQFRVVDATIAHSETPVKVRETGTREVVGAEKVAVSRLVHSSKVESLDESAQNETFLELPG